MIQCDFVDLMFLIIFFSHNVSCLFSSHVSHWLVMLKFLFAQVCHTIEKELGKSTKELFLDFDENPLATASVRSLE